MTKIRKRKLKFPLPKNKWKDHYNVYRATSAAVACCASLSWLWFPSSPLCHESYTTYLVGNLTNSVFIQNSIFCSSFFSFFFFYNSSVFLYLVLFNILEIYEYICMYRLKSMVTVHYMNERNLQYSGVCIFCSSKNINATFLNLHLVVQW